ncbi:MAG: hypothetical protein ACFBZ8_11235 [Opitutales bacterium]
MEEENGAVTYVCLRDRRCHAHFSPAQTVPGALSWPIEEFQDAAVKPSSRKCHEAHLKRVAAGLPSVGVFQLSPSDYWALDLAVPRKSQLVVGNVLVAKDISEIAQALYQSIKPRRGPLRHHWFFDPERKENSE